MEYIPYAVGKRRGTDMSVLMDDIKLPIKNQHTHVSADAKVGNILFVLQFVGQPRFSKRICMMQEQDFFVEVVAFDRDTHKGRLPPCEVTKLALIEHGKYLQRLPRLLKAFPILRKKIKDFDVVYCMGADMSLLVTLASVGIKRTKVVEVGDILPIQTSRNLLGLLVRFLDRLQVKTSNILVVTAPDFLNIYYRKWLRCRTQAVVVENKIVRDEIHYSKGDELRKEYENRGQDVRITIGYFGLLRCSWSWEVLVNVAKNNPVTHQLLLAGRPLNIAKFEETIRDLPNVTYLGEYKSPEDLSSLYRRVDLLWACYPPIDAHDWNHRWARPNRFYEACLYSKPMVSRKGSNDSVVVEQYKLGFSLDSWDVEDTARKVAAITQDQIRKWEKSFDDLPEEIYIYTTEGREIAEAIRDHTSFN